MTHNSPQFSTFVCIKTRSINYSTEISLGNSELRNFSDTFCTGRPLLNCREINDTQGRPTLYSMYRYMYGICTQMKCKYTRMFFVNRDLQVVLYSEHSLSLKPHNLLDQYSIRKR